MRIGLAGGVATVLAIAAGAARAADTVDLRQIQRELRQMRADYDSKVEELRRSYEERLRALEERLKNAETQAAAAANQAQQAEQRATAAPRTATAPQAPAPAPGGTGALGLSSPTGTFNPAISAVLDGKLGYFSKSFANYKNPGFALGDEASVPGNRGFSIGESELGLSANIDPYLYAAAIVSFHADDTVSVEEAFFQTTSLPWGFRIKGGRFLSGIGYLNAFHAHAWDFADQALPYRVFLDNQLGDDGVQVTWLAPTPLFLELGAEGLRGAAFPAAGPNNKWAGAYDAYVHIGDDIGLSHSYRTGVSYLHSSAVDRMTNNGADIFSGHSDLFIYDAVYKWAPNGNPVEQNFKLQGEFMFRNERGLFNRADYKGQQYGWYLQGVYQFMPHWVMALRHDEAKADNSGSFLAGSTLDPMGSTLRRTSAALSWYTSEFGRFRLQYNLDQTRPSNDHQFYFQYTLEMGAHPAHSY